jgi:hypothetical protein
VIHRLVTSLRALAALPLDAPAADPSLVADGADAVRLELDCPQQDLTPAQRASLRRLGEALEDGGTPAADLGRAAREACAALGIAPAEGSAGDS